MLSRPLSLTDKDLLLPLHLWFAAYTPRPRNSILLRHHYLRKQSRPVTVERTAPGAEKVAHRLRGTGEIGWDQLTVRPAKKQASTKHWCHVLSAAFSRNPSQHRAPRHPALPRPALLRSAKERVRLPRRRALLSQATSTRPSVQDGLRSPCQWQASPSVSSSTPFVFSSTASWLASASGVFFQHTMSKDILAITFELEHN